MVLRAGLYRQQVPLRRLRSSCGCWNGSVGCTVSVTVLRLRYAYMQWLLNAQSGPAAVESELRMSRPRVDACYVRSAMYRGGGV